MSLVENIAATTVDQTYAHMVVEREYMGSIEFILAAADAIAAVVRFIIVIIYYY
jgi:hypothetical protein